MKRKTTRNLLRLWLYVSHFTLYFLPDGLLRWRAKRQMARLSQAQREELERRVAYYCRLPEDCRAHFGGDNAAVTVGDFTFPWHKKHKLTQYFFDLYRSIRLFPKTLRFNYLFGDVHWETDVPTLVKSRPVTTGDTLSVLCQLNRLRHFHFINDGVSFSAKKDMLVFRNIVGGQPWRTLFIHSFSGHPLCDVGQVNEGSDVGEQYRRRRMTMEEMLQYKFIACIEGNDVATNLKWVMSSNSVAVMPPPRRESWFMEGTLRPGYHYICVRPDYSDLIDKLQYYIAHPDEAEAIVRHAHEYVNRFRDQRFEALVQHAVVREYFIKTNQGYNEPQ